MNMENGKEYYAFISYKREDEEWAKWLQHKLEHYKLPSNLNGRTDLPKEIRPVFKDTSELNPGNLPQQIHDALEQSQHLIVICSPRSAKSEWVNREVETFIGMGRTDKIIPFIIEGNAFSKSPETECFPVALRTLPSDQEILGANINEMGRDAAAVKVVAQMFGLKFDTLWQRYERERKKRRIWIIVSSIFTAFIMSGIAFWMYSQRQQTLKANWKMMENQARFVAEKSSSLLKDGDSYLAMRLLKEVLPKDLNNPQKPYTIEAEKALISASYNRNAILRGDMGEVSFASFSSDGKKIVSGTRDGTIIVWNSENGCVISTIKKDENDRWLCSDGDNICSISLDNVIRIWNIDSGEVLFYDNEQIKVERVSFCLYSSSVLIRLADKIIVLDIENGNPMYTIKGCFDFAEFSPDGKSFATCTNNGIISIWDTKSGLKKCKSFGCEYGIEAAAFSADGNYFCYSDIYDRIRVFSVADDEVLYELFDYEIKGVYSIDFSPDGDHIALSGGDLSGNQMVFPIVVWDYHNGDEVDYYWGHEYTVNTVEYSPDGGRIVSSGMDGTVRIWNVAKNEKICSLYMGDVFVNDARFSPRDERVVSAGDDVIRIWDSKSGQEILNLIGHTGRVNSASFSPDGKKIVSSSEDNSIRIWNSDTGGEIVKLIGHTDGVNTAVFSPDGKKIVSSSDDNSIRIWDSENGSEIRCLLGHKDVVWAACFSPDGKRIASSSKDETIRIWDVENGFVLHVIDKIYPGHTICFSPDGKLVLSVNAYKVCVWNAENGEEVRVSKQLLGVIEDKDAVCSVDYCPDGKRILYSTYSGNVGVLDAETMEELYVFDIHNRCVPSAKFNTDGTKIISASWDGTIQIWTFPTFQELLQTLFEIFDGCPLTPEERRQYYLE